MRKARKDDKTLQRKHRLTILLTDAEMAELRKRAGVAAMGAWVRSLIFGTAELKFDYPPASNLPHEISDSVVKLAGTREPGRKEDEGDEATGEGAAARDGVEAVQSGKRAKGRPRDHRAKSAAQHGEKSGQDHVASAVESVKSEMCGHEYGFKKCPFPNCKNYKWSD